MKQEDVKIVARLEEEIFSDSWSEQSIQETYQQERAILLVARDDEKTVGYLIAYHVLDEVELVRIAVQQDARCHGIGRKLLAKLIEIVPNGQIILEVREHNKSAIIFYLKQDFREIGVRKKFYTNPTEDAILMRKKIC